MIVCLTSGGPTDEYTDVLLQDCMYSRLKKKSYLSISINHKMCDPSASWVSVRTISAFASSTNDFSHTVMEQDRISLFPNRFPAKKLF